MTGAGAIALVPGPPDLLFQTSLSLPFRLEFEAEAGDLLGLLCPFAKGLASLLVELLALETPAVHELGDSAPPFGSQCFPLQFVDVILELLECIICCLINSWNSIYILFLSLKSPLILVFYVNAKTEIADQSMPILNS